MNLPDPKSLRPAELLAAVADVSRWMISAVLLQREMILPETSISFEDENPATAFAWVRWGGAAFVFTNARERRLIGKLVRAYLRDPAAVIPDFSLPGEARIGRVFEKHPILLSGVLYAPEGGYWRLRPPVGSLADILAAT